ncbi:hypothetical protein SAMN05443245_5908 [Paraburkholderia fungorum]|jgi:hypothetical protein|uniref:Uncharacterized protein n=1 Tax=Paraburkholderia fungorum TaxID=134537 RepID=A0A1H1IZ00_9BURK|nr:hypothetical protein SAMN05443245_5908 [Paraburkholderia fungorum]
MAFVNPHRLQGEDFQGVLPQRSVVTQEDLPNSPVARTNGYPTPYIVFHIQTKRERAKRHRPASQGRCKQAARRRSPVRWIGFGCHALLRL